MCLLFVVVASFLVDEFSKMFSCIFISHYSVRITYLKTSDVY